MGQTGQDSCSSIYITADAGRLCLIRGRPSETQMAKFSCHFFFCTSLERVTKNAEETYNRFTHLFSSTQAEEKKSTRALKWSLKQKYSRCDDDPTLDV